MFVQMATSLFILILTINVTSAQNRRNDSRLIPIRERRILEALFETGYYDKRIRPPGTNLSEGYVIVNVSMVFESINTIDVNNMEFSCVINLRQMWKDKRLEYNDKDGSIQYITLSDTDKIWTPDLYFPNAKHAEMQKNLKPNILIRMYANGYIDYSTRIYLALYCPMDLRNYPLDTQICSIKTASYGYTIKDIVLHWKKEAPVEKRNNINLRGFSFKKFFTSYCTEIHTTGEYACLKLDLYFDRNFHYYLLIFYLPFILLTIVSWVSFWLDPHAVTARILIAIVTILAMAIQSYWITASLPPVSYTKAIDVWTGTCLTFVFIALVEFTIVNYISRNEERQNEINLYKYDIQHTSALDADKIEDDKMEDASENIEMKPFTSEVEGDEASGGKSPKKKMPEIIVRNLGIVPLKTWFYQTFPTRSQKIDGISRVCFPLVFLVFNFCYWLAYM